MNVEFLQLCKDGDLEKVTTLLREKRANVNIFDSDGMSGLMHAGTWLFTFLDYCYHFKYDLNRSDKMFKIHQQ